MIILLFILCAIYFFITGMVFVGVYELFDWVLSLLMALFWPITLWVVGAVKLGERIMEEKNLWQSIHGPESWEVNPWLFAIGFKILSTTGKPELKL